MANFYGSGRSNYVRVKDLELFSRVASTVFCAEVVGENPDDTVAESDRIALLANSEIGHLEEWFNPDDPNILDLFKDYPELENYREDEERIDSIRFIADSLQDGEVFVYTSAGNEKLRYVSGESWAVNSKGALLFVSINDIYRKVKEVWGTEPTRAEY